MKTVVIGLNHKTADVELREKLAFNGQKLEDGIRQIRELPEIRETVIVSTCNRVEIYLRVKDVKKAFEAVKDFFVRFFEIKREALDNALYLYHDMEAVRHIFRVSSSLDSMVVGEPQILGQLKDAFEFALERKTTGVLLNRLLKKSISVAKRVRTETKIAENAVSISFAAVELAKKIFADLSEKTFMLLGAGEMAELAAKHMINNGVKDIIIANRTYETGCNLAKEFKGRAIRFDDYIDELAHADILICSTGAQNYVLMKGQMQKVMKERKNRPVFLIDISVPRNIDPGINDLDNVYLYDIDDLQGTVDTNILERQKEARKADDIIEKEVETFKKWLSSLDTVPTVVALREKAEAIKKEELEKLLNRLPEIGEKEKKAIEGMAGSIINKLIHAPTVALREDSEDRDIMIAVIKRLYGLNGEDDDEK
ncbi:MAG: glutamyl-tRNA reductase [Nitrospira bacterium HGW-Nitrospira-1]|nr:MAG: glutamyl-tRNA reductase [Nitrospira bacterium HGW-Nitrospira-1]